MSRQFLEPLGEGRPRMTVTRWRALEEREGEGMGNGEWEVVYYKGRRKVGKEEEEEEKRKQQKKEYKENK